MNDDVLVHNICLALTTHLLLLNSFSIGNVWGIFEVAYLLAGGSY